MYYTYVLLCRNRESNTHEFYTGFTDNLKERLETHKAKGVQTTKKFDILSLVYYEACMNKTDARRRELELKTGFGRGYIKKRMKEYLKDILRS